MQRISVVQPEHKICSKCGQNGHNREDCNLRENQYYKPGFFNKCSRCDQPGHNRSNSRKCSLFNSYKYENYTEIVAIQTGRNITIRNRRNRQEKFIRILKKMVNQLEIYTTEIRNIINNQQIFTNDLHNTLYNISINISTIKYDINAITNQINRRDIQIFLIETNVFLDNYQSQIMNIMLHNLSLSELDILNNAVLNSIHTFNGINDWVIIVKNISEFYRNMIKKIKITKEDSDVNAIFDCSICYETQSNINMCVTGCNHVFCVDCVTSYCKTRRSKPNIPCPMCRTDIKELKFNKESILNDTLLELS
jgi:hypothetical protein